MLSLIALVIFLLGLYIGIKVGIWYANSPTRKAASAVSKGAQGGLNGAKSLFRMAKDKVKDVISGDNKPKGPKDPKEKP